MREAQDDLEVTQRILEEAKLRLHEVEDGIATMQAKYRECIAKKEELELKCEQCEQRLGRADKVRAPLGRAHGHSLPPMGWRGLSSRGGGPGVAVPSPSPATLVGGHCARQGHPGPASQSPPHGLSLQLINGLSDERVRWQETVENLEHMLDSIFGDVLVAAGFVAYLGPFTVRDPPHPCREASLP